MPRGVLPVLTALLFAPCAVWPQGHPLGPEFQVNTYTTGDQGGPFFYLDRPSVTSDSAGNFVVVWTSSSQDGSSDGIFGQRYDASGAPLGPEFRVNAYTTLSQSHPDIAADPSGNFVVVWESDSQNGSSVGVFGQRYASSGVPLGPEFRVNTFTTDDQGYPSVAADPTGGFVVAWRSYVGNGGGIFAQRFASAGSPLGSEFRVNTTTTAPQRFPSIASDAAGNFIVVWQGATIAGGLNPMAFGQRYSASGAPLGSEFRVNTSAPGYQFLPAVAAAASGNFVVVWYTDDPFTPEAEPAFGQRFASTGAPLGSEFRLNTTTSPAPTIPSVAMDSTGDFVVVWESDHDGGLFSGVFGQRFANTGAALGPEFLVNTYTTADQSRPGVASDSAGRFVVVWRSDGQDGSGGGVFGQRYSMIVPVELTRFTVE